MDVFIKNTTKSIYYIALLLLWITPYPSTVTAALPALHMDRPGDKKDVLPPYQEDTPASELILPPLKKHLEQDKISRGIIIFVKQIKITGNTVFSDEELNELVSPYENRKINTEKLQILRQALTLRYINKGYINSGVIIPDQQVSNGVIELQAIEGSLTDINVTGNERLRSEYIHERLMLGAKTPLNINKLQQSLLILKQNPLIKKIRAELKPGTLPGESILNAELDEKKPYSFKLAINNHTHPSVGAERGELEILHQNLSGYGDSIQLSYGQTEGLDDFNIQYNFPLNPRDTTIGFFFERGNSIVIETPFDILDIKSKSETAGLRLSHPFFKTPNKDFTMSLSLEHRESDTFMLGLPFSFSIGAENGHSAVTVLRFSQKWLDRNQSQVIALSSTFNFGVDAFDASINHGIEDGKFTSWLGQTQWAQRIGNQGKQIIFRADTQLTNDPLLPLEQFSIGGISSVRGYRENQLVRDNGFIASVEFRMPILDETLGKNKLQIAPFIDYGRSWNQERNTPLPENISSVGIGFRWAPTKNIYGDIYWGKRLRTVTNPDNDLQDDGIHFQLQMTL